MPIRIREFTKAGGGTYDYVYSKKVPHDEIWCLQGIAYENETGARGTFRRGIERSDDYEWYAEHENPAADELIFTDKVLFMIPGDRLAIRQASATANDIIRLYAHGYKVKSKYIPGGD